MSLASPAALDSALSGLITNADYLGLNTGSPGTSNTPPTNEIVPTSAFNSGNRAPISWGTPAASAVSNVTNALNTGCPSSGTAITDFSTNSSATPPAAYGDSGGGTNQIGGTLNGASISFPSGGTLTIGVGALTLTAS